MLTVAEPVLEVSAGTAGSSQTNRSTHGRTPTVFRSASVRRVLARVGELPFASHSDADLRKELINLKSPSLHHGPEDLTEDHQAAVFALVDESVSRRMGAWRFFDPYLELQELGSYHTIADQLMESPQYIAFSQSWNHELPTVETFIKELTKELTPCLAAAGLDQDDWPIVGALIYVKAIGGGRYGWDILLPAEFYLALARKDAQSLLAFRATDEQVLAGILLYRGGIVEMTAGEGKTIAAVFPAVMHTVLGRSVHIITSNDYLASRDCGLLAPVCRSLGISVDAVLSHMIDDERREAYAQQVVYGTMREFGFDFLRDNLKMSPIEQVQGPLEVAIVDEADHALIDEARTPMIIAGDPVVTRRAYARVKKCVIKLISLQKDIVQGLATQLAQAEPKSKVFLQLLAKLLLAQPENQLLREQLSKHSSHYKRILSLIYQDGFDYPGHTLGDTLTGELFYTVDPERRFVTLTEKGQALLETDLGSFFDGRDLERELALVSSKSNLSLAGRRGETYRLTRQLSFRYNLGNQVYQMLRAYLLLEKDVDYLVTEDSIVLIDRYTGRPRPDSRYQEGLQQALEAKEGVTVNHDGEVQAQISVQGFAGQYQRLAGMTGTARSAADEFRQKYALDVTVIPTTRPLLRRDFSGRIYATQSEKLAAIAEEVTFCQRVGRPVLVGTWTVEQSAEMSRLLTDHGVIHRLLNAVTSHEEAQIVKEAGAFGAVTVATNMAGRGTDIILDPDLNRRIAIEYLDLAHQLLTGDVSQVALRCYTKEEADFLWAEASGSGSYDVKRNMRGEWEELVMRSKVNPDGCHQADAAACRLDFGLGLYVIGTEFNESPRIDLQLRGRSGRQGEFGWARRFLSLEDRPLSWQVEAELGSSCAGKTDPSGRIFFEGKEVDQCLDRLQKRLDREGAVQRGLVQDYAGVTDSLTKAYYRARRRMMESSDLMPPCVEFAREKGTRLAEKYFAGSIADDYGLQFRCLAEELEEDYGLNCSDLWGMGLDQLPDELGGLLVTKLALRASPLSRKGFSDLARLLWLQTSDELWRDHICEQQELMLNAQLSNHGHQSAVADYVIQSYSALAGFQRRVTDLFLSRLLTFPTIEPVDCIPKPAVTVDLVEDTALILA